MAPGAADALHRPCRLTAADERAYTGYAESERHKGFEVIDVGFGPPEDDESGESGRRMSGPGYIRGFSGPA